MPTEIIVLIAYKNRNIVLTHIMYIVWGVLSVAYITLVMRSGKNRKKRREITVNKLRWSFVGCRTLFTIVMVFAILFLGIFYRAIPVPTQITADSLNCSVDDCEDSLSRLSIDEFDTLSREEKLDILRDICRVEFTELGVGHGFSLKCDALYDELIAQYSTANYTITFNEKFFDEQSSIALIKTVCHESYHAYQHELLENARRRELSADEEFSQKLEVYREELSHYCSAHENVEKYRAQTIEIDADAYADSAFIKYLRFFDTT